MGRDQFDAIVRMATILAVGLAGMTMSQLTVPSSVPEHISDNQSLRYLHHTMFCCQAQMRNQPVSTTW